MLVAVQVARVAMAPLNIAVCLAIQDTICLMECVYRLVLRAALLQICQEHARLVLLLALTVHPSLTVVAVLLTILFLILTNAIHPIG